MDDSGIVITGARGQLGLALSDKYPNSKKLSSDELDITDSQAVSAYDWSNIKYILNAGAYTNVDGAEKSDGRISAWQVNAGGSANLVKVAIEHDITLMHISTEYVFDGTKNPHLENEELSPLGVYAQSKAAADVAVSVLPKYYILRTSWVIGDGKNFVRTMLGLAKKGVSPTVIADDTGRPTFTNVLVEAIDHLLNSNASYGIYNCSNDGDSVSWADLARQAFSNAGLNVKVNDTTHDDYYKDKPEASPRPKNSTFDLSKIKAIGFVPTDWKDDLRVYVTKEMQTP